MTTLPTTQQTLQHQISVLTEQLAPASDTEIFMAVRTLMAAGLALPSGMQQDKAPEIYAHAMSGISVYGIHRATEKLLRGEYDINRSFVPTPPELAAICRAETRVIRDDRARLQDRLATLESLKEEPEPRNPQAIAHVKALRQSFQRQHAAQKAAGEVPQDPMSNEKAEYYAKIMSINDAPGISAEQAAYRRHIANEINNVLDEGKEAAE